MTSINYTCQTASKIKNKLEKMALVKHFNLKAAHRRASCSGLFWPNLYCACAQTVISELPVKFVTPSADLATLISYTCIW